MCPFAHRVEIALAEANVSFSCFEIEDLRNKPQWYIEKVNPASQPSAESIKLTGSLILVEFIADLFPQSKILPADPVLRAKARHFIDVVSTDFVPAWVGTIFSGQPWEPFWAAIEAVQALLPADKPYVLGDAYSAADIAITSFLARMKVALRNDTGAFKEGEGTKATEILFSGQRFVRLARYLEVLKARESFGTFNKEYITEKYRLRFAERTASHH
ncbi:glutathione S-transferase [Mycena leptocephala]|nr:glutathione S-transferase [Mycena leptocephala]